MIPNTSITKQDGNTGVTLPSADGIIAIIAPSVLLPANTPTSVTSPKAALTGAGYSKLADFASFMMLKTGKQVVMLAPTCDTAAAYSAIAQAGTGTSVATAHSGAAPLDDYRAIIKVLTGGTVGTGGITYTYTLDNGDNTSAIQALGTSNSISIPNTGIQIDLTHTTNTLVAGDTISFTTTSALMSDANLSTAYAALQTTALPFEAVLVAGVLDTSAVGTVDTWLQGREAVGKFKHFYGNTRHMTSGETESTFLTAMTTAYASASSIRGLVAADCSSVANSIPGWAWTMLRDAALFVAAKAMASDIAHDPAFIADGPIGGWLYDPNTGDPLHHDEAQSPGLDDIRLTALRSVEGQSGVFINNARVISTSDSDYQFIQHVRVMNKACALAWQLLTSQLSLGVQAAPNAAIGPGVYITETDAQRIEALVNQLFDANLVRPKRVSGALFILHRDDDLSSNAGATVNADIQIAALRYIKQFNANAFFVKSIAAQAA